MECPAEVFELLLSKPVAVAGRIAGVVRRSIALDGQDELARFGWMTSCASILNLEQPTCGTTCIPLAQSASYTSASKSFMGSLVSSP